MSNWPSSTRAILASGQPRRPRTRASAWRWSSCQEPAKASFFYRVDGLWNGSSPGLPGSVASPGTMKDCRKPWKDCTSSLSPASCSPEAAVSSHSSLQALCFIRRLDPMIVVALASDHAGVEFKKELGAVVAECGFEPLDLGVND